MNNINSTKQIYWTWGCGRMNLKMRYEGRQRRPIRRTKQEECHFSKNRSREKYWRKFRNDSMIYDSIDLIKTFCYFSCKCISCLEKLFRVIYEGMKIEAGRNCYTPRLDIGDVNMISSTLCPSLVTNGKSPPRGPACPIDGLLHTFIWRNWCYDEV